MTGTKTALYIAYHYPPILGSSGVHRTLAFTRYLTDNNWNVSVLTSSLNSYDNWSEQQFKFIPDKVNVIRAFGLNTAKQLSFKGKYFSWMALPDNWQSWILGGVVSGLFSILKNRPEVIVSTYPIASAHIIGYCLHKITGIPWVADMRDPMAQASYPSDPAKKRVFQWIEKKIVKHCKHAIVTAQGAKTLYQNRFPECRSDFWQLIPNGYDDEIFMQVEADLKIEKPEKFTLLHSGVIYPSERDPTQLFEAISALKESGQISSDNFELRLRATGHDDLFKVMLAKWAIEDIVTLHASIPFKNALQEMYSVDALLLLQAENCNYQIPAKAYEYIRVQKPILALTPIEGDTGQLLSKAGVFTIAPLNNVKKIMLMLESLLSDNAKNASIPIKNNELFEYSRQYHAVKFEQLLTQAIN